MSGNVTHPEKNLHASVPPALLARAEEAAQQEHISIDELVREAMERRLEERREILSGAAQTGKKWSRSKAKIDWSECPLVEIDPEIQSGAPCLRGTRMPVSAIVDNAAYGVSPQEIAEQFEIPRERVEAVLTYVKSHRVAHPVR